MRMRDKGLLMEWAWMKRTTGAKCTHRCFPVKRPKKFPIVLKVGIVPATMCGELRIRRMRRVLEDGGLRKYKIATNKDVALTPASYVNKRLYQIFKNVKPTKTRAEIRYDATCW